MVKLSDVWTSQQLYQSHCIITLLNYCIRYNKFKHDPSENQYLQYLLNELVQQSIQQNQTGDTSAQMQRERDAYAPKSKHSLNPLKVNTKQNHSTTKNNNNSIGQQSMDHIYLEDPRLKNESTKQLSKKSLSTAQSQRILKQQQNPYKNLPYKLWEFYHQIGTNLWLIILSIQNVRLAKQILQVQQVNNQKFAIINQSQCEQFFQSSNNSEINKWYKIVTDLSSLPKVQAIKYQRVDEINIFISGESFLKANQKKNEDNRIKHISTDLKNFIKKASNQSQNTEPFLFSFMLGSKQKNIQEILLKNMTTCAALTLKVIELRKFFKKFVTFLKKFLIQPNKNILHDQVERDIKQYQNLFSNDLKVNKNTAIKFIIFYRQSNFLAKMIRFATNTSLFNLQQTQNLLYLIYQTYNSFKCLRQNFQSTTKKQFKQCYHGVILRSDQFNQLCFQNNLENQNGYKNDFQLKANGSISASKKQQVALDHLKIKSQEMKKGKEIESNQFKGCVLVIHYKQNKRNEFQQQLSGGFFQISKQLQQNQDDQEEQIVFNVLSDFKFLRIEEVSIVQNDGLKESTKNITKIHFQYNSIFDLIQKKRENPGILLTKNQTSAIQTIQKFWYQMKNFKDLGQLYRYLKYPKLAQEYYNSCQKQQVYSRNTQLLNYFIIKQNQCLIQMGKVELAQQKLKDLIISEYLQWINQYQPNCSYSQLLQIFKDNFEKNPFSQNSVQKLIQIFIFSQAQTQPTQPKQIEDKIKFHKRNLIQLIQFLKYYVNFFKQQVFCKERKKLVSTEPENQLIQTLKIIFFIKQKTEQEKKQDAETIIQTKQHLQVYKQSRILVFQIRRNILNDLKSILESSEHHIQESYKYLKDQRQELCKEIKEYEKQAPQQEKQVLKILLFLNGSKQHNLTLEKFEEIYNNIQEPSYLQAHNVLIKDYISQTQGNNLNQIPEKGKEILIDQEKIQKYVQKFIQNEENILNSILEQCNYNVKDQKYVLKSLKFATNLYQFKRWSQSLKKLKILVQQNKESKKIQIVKAYFLMSKTEIQLGNIGQASQSIERADKLLFEIKRSRKNLLSDEIKIQQFSILMTKKEHPILKNDQQLHKTTKEYIQKIQIRLKEKLEQNNALIPMEKQKQLLAEIYKLKAKDQFLALNVNEVQNSYNKALEIVRKLTGNYSLEVMKIYIEICKASIKTKALQKYKIYLKKAEQVLGCYRQKKGEVISTPQFWYYHMIKSQQQKQNRNKKRAYQHIQKALSDLRQTDKTTLKKLRLYTQKFKLAITAQTNKLQIKKQLQQLTKILEDKTAFQKNRWDATQRNNNWQYNITKDLKIHYYNIFMNIKI